MQIDGRHNRHGRLCACAVALRTTAVSKYGSGCRQCCESVSLPLFSFWKSQTTRRTEAHFHLAGCSFTARFLQFHWPRSCSFDTIIVPGELRYLCATATFALALWALWNEPLLKPLSLSNSRHSWVCLQWCLHLLILNRFRQLLVGREGLIFSQICQVGGRFANNQPFVPTLLHRYCSCCHDTVPRYACAITG